MKEIDILNRVRRCYVEASGGFSIFKADSDQPGLSIVPPWTLSKEMPVRSDAPVDVSEPLPCVNCATAVDRSEAAQVFECARCGGVEWRAAKP